MKPCVFVRIKETDGHLYIDQIIDTFVFLNACIPTHTASYILYQYTDDDLG